MKLLHVIAGTDPESGGPIEALLRISEVLIRDGHQVAVVSLESDEDVASRGFTFPIAGLGRGTRLYRYNSWPLLPAHRYNLCTEGSTCLTSAIM